MSETVKELRYDEIPVLFCVYLETPIYKATIKDAGKKNQPWRILPSIWYVTQIRFYLAVVVEQMIHQPKVLL